MNAPNSEVPLTFANFDLVSAEPKDIYSIGAAPGEPGVLPEMAEAFGYKLATEPEEANLRGLVQAIGQAKTLQDNIAGVQERLGTDDDAVALARSWVTRAGFLEPVSRAYVHPEIGLPDRYVSVMTDGTANWMDWRAQTLVSLRDRTGYTAPALLVAGNGVMRVSENPKKVKEGMTRADYMHEHVQPYLTRRRIEALVVTPSTDEGDKVMDGAVAALKWLDYRGAVVLASNGGAWPQNAGQLRQAIMRVDADNHLFCLLYTSPSPRDGLLSRMPSSA